MNVTFAWTSGLGFLNGPHMNSRNGIINHHTQSEMLQASQMVAETWAPLPLQAVFSQPSLGPMAASQRQRQVGLTAKIMAIHVINSCEERLVQRWITQAVMEQTMVRVSGPAD